MSGLSVVSVADRAGFHIFAAALRASDYFHTLEGGGPFTVFAPSDEAFGKFSKAALDTLLNDDRAYLQVVLGYHIASGKVAAARLNGKRIRGVMQAGGDVIIDGRSGLRVNTARVIKPDLAARNGVVHGIDALLAPRGVAAAIS
ncbi:MAG: fasciclin domain-containing protein [Hyphomonadaceae bacterium]|nr:fasciclin domain-containing protein [Hyphomonadaceae bacterium]